MSEKNKMTTKPTVRVAHASDIHLDTDYYGGEINIASRAYCRRIFATLLERIAADGPDLFLLPGDLFDSNRASPETIAWAMERLAALPFPVAMIPGNHDCLEPDGIFRRHDFSRLPNVDMLLSAEGENRDFAALGVTVWGKGMEDHSPEYIPLEGLAAPQPERWNLALAHGIYVGQENGGFRSSRVAAGQIEASGYDYIALGHHHALMDVSGNGTTAFYSGAPFPLSSDDRGTYLLIELREGEKPEVTIRTTD